MVGQILAVFYPQLEQLLLVRVAFRLNLVQLFDLFPVKFAHGVDKLDCVIDLSREFILPQEFQNFTKVLSCPPYQKQVAVLLLLVLFHVIGDFSIGPCTIEQLNKRRCLTKADRQFFFALIQYLV